MQPFFENQDINSLLNHLSWEVLQSDIISIEECEDFTSGSSEHNLFKASDITWIDGACYVADLNFSEGLLEPWIVETHPANNLTFFFKFFPW